MSWLAVDKNGTEYVYRHKPKRLKKRNKWSDIYVKFICEDRLCASVDGYENQSTFGTLVTIRKTTRSKLPKGSIEKLIGKKLTWEDEPFELK